MRTQDPQFAIIAQNTARVALIEGDTLAALAPNLQRQGFATIVINPTADSLLELSNTTLLLMDITTARRPNSGQLARATNVVVFSANLTDELPAWLRARHIHLRHYANFPQDVFEQLTPFLPQQPPGFSVAPPMLEHLPQLFGIAQFLSGHLDINDLFERVLGLAPYLNAEFASLLVLENKQIFHYRSTQPGREELTHTVGRRFARRLVNYGLEGWVLSENRSAVVPDTSQDARWLKAPYLPEDKYAVVVLPLVLERVEAQAVYSLGHSELNHFTPEQLPFLEVVAAQIGKALETAILFRNQTQRSGQLALINEVSQAATSILNLEVMLRTVVQAIRRSFSFYSAAIYLYNRDTNLVELHAQSSTNRHPSGAPNYPAAYQLHQGMVGWAAATKKTALANDVTQDSRYSPTADQGEIRAKLCIPIVMGIKTIGVLDIQSTQLEAFEPYHVTALETLADQLAIAIENARLYDAIHQRVQELKMLNEIGQAIASSLDLQETLTLITAQAIRVMNVAAASVALLNEQRGEVRFAAASGEGADAVIGISMARGQGIAGWVTESGQPVIVPDVYTDHRFFADIDKSSGFTTRSILCVPLQTKGHTIGAIEVMNKKESTFNRDDQELLQALAAPAATAIENARLYQEQTKTIKRLAETQSQLVQSAKLAAVGELAAGIAHEINNPLTSIIGLTSLILDTLPETEPNTEMRTDLTVVNAEAVRASKIVRGLLNFARTDAPKRQRTDFNQLIEAAIFLVYTKSVSYKVELKKLLADLPAVYLDVNQFKQVVVNLLNNAVQAMLEHNNSGNPAVLTVATASNPAAEPPEIVFSISDTGPGIAPEHLPKIFDPFFTTKEVGQGTGLGLSISYGIVEQHGGTIRVESTPGQGTCFTVTLPADPNHNEPIRDIEPW